MDNTKYSITKPIIEDLRNKKENDTIDKIIEESIKEIRTQHEEWKESLEEELPTKKVPNFQFVEKKKPENYEPIKICIFKCNKEYEEFYPVGIHGAILKAENEFMWFAVPVKEPYLGTIEWNKTVWSLIYTFDITLDLFC